MGTADRESPPRQAERFIRLTEGEIRLLYRQKILSPKAYVHFVLRFESEHNPAKYLQNPDIRQRWQISRTCFYRALASLRKIGWLRPVELIIFTHSESP
jgi:hypothetical protein